MSDYGGAKRVLLAFSGGTDSSYAAVKLAAKGYRVEALILNMDGDKVFIDNAVSKARNLGLPCRIMDIKALFREQVIDYFICEYLTGRTPAPCTVCNPLIKWKTLYNVAVAEGFDHIATGHYFRTQLRDGICYAAKAVDFRKDQSYYLWMLPEKILMMALTPMGDEIKKYVVERTPEIVEKESMGVCFLGGRDYRDFLREKYAGHPSCLPGDIVDGDGVRLGKHQGCAFYTIGQKKGLDLPPGHTVTGIDSANNRLMAGKSDELIFRHITLKNYRLAGGEVPAGWIPEIKIRGYGSNPAGGCSFSISEDRMTLTFEEPVRAPAKGQPAVFYDGDLVIGGGFIEEFY